MPVPENLKEVTRKEWRALGFYYTRDDQPRQAWRVVGSLAGLAAFHAMLVGYVTHPSNARLSEHQHYGPYSYLKLMTSSEAGIDAHSIRGTLDDLSRLAGLVRAALEHAKLGDVIPLGHDYVERTSCELLLDVRDDSFDPASDDPELL
jgi:hypothetical protein